MEEKLAKPVLSLNDKNNHISDLGLDESPVPKL
jgi:hypothetical protein